MLYWAYGSNTNLRQMAVRCPTARAIGPFHLNDSRLVFRGVADVEYAEGEHCPGALWTIQREDEEALDNYEGVEHGLYRKVWLSFKFVKTNKVRRCLVYQMNETGVMPPDSHYLQSIRQGYADFGLDQAYLDEAVRRAWEDKELTSRLIHRRRGIKRAKVPALVPPLCNQADLMRDDTAEVIRAADEVLAKTRGDT
jgi:hypothetical protein